MSADANEPLLTLEETNALLDAMRIGGEGGSEVEDADLASPERPLRSALDRADVCARAMSQAVDKLMIRLSGGSTATEEQPAEIIPHKVIRGSAAQGSGVATLKAGDGSMGLLIIGPTLVSFLLDRRMGAPLKADEDSEPRLSLSPLDQRLLMPFISALAEVLGQYWSNDPATFQVDEIFADPADVPVLSQYDPMLQLGLRITPAGMPGDQVLFALSVGAVRGTLPRKKISSGPAISDGDRYQMMRCVEATLVRCVAVLGRTKSTVGHVLALKSGDVLRLDGSPEQPVSVLVGDTPVLTGKPVASSGNLGVQVTDVVGIG